MSSWDGVVRGREVEKKRGVYFLGGRDFRDDGISILNQIRLLTSISSFRPPGVRESKVYI